MSSCSGCEALPPSIADAGTLYLALPLAHTGAKVCRGLSEAGIEHCIHDDVLISFAVTHDNLKRFVEIVTNTLSSVELNDAKSLLLSPGAQLAVTDLVRMDSLANLASRIEGRWLVELLAEERLATYFQPIVDCREPENVFAYECLTRGVQANGDLIYPDRLYATARASNLLYHLDRAARLRAIASAAEHNIPTKIFINFNPTSIYDPAFCLRSTVRAIEQSSLSVDQFVFEVVESDRTPDEQHLRRVLEYYRQAGCAVALDDVGSGYSSLNLLSKLKPDFIKLDMELIRDADHDPHKAHIAARLLELARGLGVKTIAEGVETEAEWQWLMNHGANYAQGYLFARPARVPSPPLMMAAVD